MSLIFSVYDDFAIVGTNGTNQGNGISDINYEGKVIIPIFHENKKVTEIGQYCFHSCIYIKEIIILSELVSINTYSLYNCRSLESINIPPTVKFIGYAAFCMRDTGVASGSLTITFDGESQLSYICSFNPSYKEIVVIYFCGQHPATSESYHFLSVSQITIYSSTMANFLGKSTTSGTCPDNVESDMLTSFNYDSFHPDHCFYFHKIAFLASLIILFMKY